MKNNYNSLLSVCIPTYNRRDLLRFNVLELIKQAEPLNVPIYISDNCSDDGTPEIVEFVQQQYSKIINFRQKTNINEMNFAFILRNSETKYSWLLGDKNRINDGYLKIIYDKIKNDDFDLIVVNSAPPQRVKDVPSKVYYNSIELLEDIGWHMSLVCSLIISKQLINKINFERFSNTNFLHTAGVFDALITNNCKVLWLNEPVIWWSDTFKINSYIDKMFPIFIDSWANSIMSISPMYPLKSKLKVIKDHGIKQLLFTLVGFLDWRSRGIYNYGVFKTFSSRFNMVTNIPKYILWIIAFIPPKMLVQIKIIYLTYYLSRKNNSSNYY